MGGLIPFLIFISIMLGDKRDRRRSDLIRWLIFGAVILGILSELLFSPIGIIGLIAAGIYLYNRYAEKQKHNSRSGERQTLYEKNTNTQGGFRGKDYQNGSYGKTGGYGQNTAKGQTAAYGQTTNGQAAAHGQTSNGQGAAYQQNADTQSAQNWQRTEPKPAKVKTSLPRRAAKRSKILAAFDKKYDLCLTEEQMNSIVNSSYMSEIWRKELEAMQERYDHVTEWLCGGSTDWLRTYMYVFRIQEITSDIKEQEEICKYSFETIFQYVDTLDGYGLSDKIRMVNDKYFTNFDDITFMTAYRFLERHGLSHDLTKAEIPAYRETSEADRLTEQYL